MVRKIILAVLIILLILLTFFGVGPILLADGTDRERLVTILVVALLYVILFVAMYFVVKHRKK